MIVVLAWLVNGAVAAVAGFITLTLISDGFFGASLLYFILPTISSVTALASLHLGLGVCGRHSQYGLGVLIVLSMIHGGMIFNSGFLPFVLDWLFILTLLAVAVHCCVVVLAYQLLHDENLFPKAGRHADAVTEPVGALQQVPFGSSSLPCFRFARGGSGQEPLSSLLLTTKERDMVQVWIPQVVVAGMLASTTSIGAAAYSIATIIRGVSRYHRGAFLAYCVILIATALVSLLSLFWLVTRHTFSALVTNTSLILFTAVAVALTPFLELYPPSTDMVVVVVVDVIAFPFALWSAACFLALLPHRTGSYFTTGISHSEEQQTLL